MKKSVIVGIVALVIVLAGASVLLAQNGDDTKSSDSSTDSSMNMNTDSSSSDSSSSTATATNSVEIKSYAFGPANITVKKGTKVTWTNQDAVGHTVTDDGSGSGLDSQLLQKGDSYSFTFDKVGTFKYLCTPHPYMKATVTVTE